MKGQENALARQRQFDLQIERLGMGLAELDRMVADYWRGAVDLERVKIKLGDGNTIDTLVILEGTGDDGTPVVGFHSQCPPSEAVAGALRRAASGQIRWREDGYRIERGTKNGAEGAEK